MDIPTLADVRAAAERIRPHVHRTPVLTCATLDRIVGCELFFKAENLQRAGVFKARGATHAVLSLSPEQAAAGVATHSSGNHAAALALAASIRGVPAHVVMPTSAPPVKRAATSGYGAQITPCAPTLRAREDGLARVVARTGAHVVHPYDDPRVIAGQGTAALELVEAVPDLDLVLAPVGGGGLMSGTAIATHGVSARTRLVGAEPAGADDAFRSLQQGLPLPSVNPRTVADGLLTSLSERTFTVLSTHLDRIVTVEEEAIVTAMRMIWERMKVVVEPSSAVPLAALLQADFGQRDARVGVILSGGNVQLDQLPW